MGMEVSPVPEGSWQESIKSNMLGALDFPGLVYTTRTEISLPQHQEKKLHEVGAQ